RLSLSTDDQPLGSGSRCGPLVGAEEPAVALRVTHTALTAAVVGVSRGVQRISAGRHRVGEHPLDVVGDHVGAAGAWCGRPLGGLSRPHAAEHDGPTAGPGQFGVVDPLTIAIDDCLLKPEPRQKADESAGVAGGQRGPDTWCGVLAHAAESAARVRVTAGIAPDPTAPARATLAADRSADGGPSGRPARPARYATAQPRSE